MEFVNARNEWKMQIKPTKTGKKSGFNSVSRKLSSLYWSISLLPTSLTYSNQEMFFKPSLPPPHSLHSLLTAHPVPTHLIFFFLQKWSSFIFIFVYIFSTAAFLLEIFSCNILSGLQVSKRNIFRIYRSLFKHMNQSIRRLLIIFSLQLKNNIQIIHC